MKNADCDFASIGDQNFTDHERIQGGFFANQKRLHSSLTFLASAGFRDGFSGEVESGFERAGRDAEDQFLCGGDGAGGGGQDLGDLRLDERVECGFVRDDVLDQTEFATPSRQEIVRR